MIVHWPAGIADRGALRHTPGHFIDLMPTLIELSGSKVGGDFGGATPPPLPGHSLVPALAKDVTIERDFLYWHHMNHRAIRVGDWKLVSAGTKGGVGPWELYNVREDRSELKNLAAEQPEKVAELSKLWQQHEAEFIKQAGPVEPVKAPRAK